MDFPDLATRIEGSPDTIQLSAFIAEIREKCEPELANKIESVLIELSRQVKNATEEIQDGKWNEIEELRRCLISTESLRSKYKNAFDAVMEFLRSPS